MAGVMPHERWTAVQSREQFKAIAQLRWNIFRNGFRRKGGAGELVARIIFLPLLGLLALGPVAGAGVAGYYIASSQHFERLAVLTWALFALWLLVSINISPPGLSFDVQILLRFPISFARYVTARLFFGLLSPANVIGTLALIAADVGIGMARVSLLPWATLALGCFAVANVLFVRMVFAWVDRWLSTRRAREVLTAFVLFASLGAQYLNVTLNPGLQGGRHHANHLPFFLKVLHRIEPVAALLPPGLTASSITASSRGHLVAAIACLLGVVGFACLFLAVYSWRMRLEFRGENLDEGVLDKRRKPEQGRRSSGGVIAGEGGLFGTNPILAACLRKEFVYLRRNTSQLYGFLAPVFMVFLFAGRLGMSGQAGEMVFPAAVAYSILGVSILSYNCLGMDGAGVQFYFLAPVRLRDVFLAKNLTGFLLNAIELVLIYGVIRFVGRGPSALMATATVLWLLFVIFTNVAVGNLRSLTAAKKIDLSKISRKQTSQLSALMALGVVVACCGVGVFVYVVGNHLHRPWLVIPVFAILAAVGFVFYLGVLRGLESVAFRHRETLMEELSRV